MLPEDEELRKLTSPDVAHNVLVNLLLPTGGGKEGEENSRN